MTTTYTLTTGTRDEYNDIQAKLIGEFTNAFTGAEVTAIKDGTGKIESCVALKETVDSVIFNISFAGQEPKKFLAFTSIKCGGLKFTDESLRAVYDDFVEVHTTITTQLYNAEDEARRHEKDEAKKAERLKKAEANYEKLKEKSLRDFDELTKQARTKVTETDEFYYAIGWLAAHANSVSAALPDYLDDAFSKYFGVDTPRRVIDSKKRSPAGWQSQWSWAFKISLKKPETIPANFASYLGQSGKEITKTSFVWDLVTDYGFKFGKKQDVVEIMSNVPIEYVPMFNAGMKA